MSVGLTAETPLAMLINEKRWNMPQSRFPGIKNYNTKKVFGSANNSHRRVHTFLEIKIFLYVKNLISKKNLDQCNLAFV